MAPGGLIGVRGKVLKNMYNPTGIKRELVRFSIVKLKSSHKV
jgi:hypothetical protein